MQLSEPQLWINLARADLQLAREHEPDDSALVRGLRCFHCQQAAEKSIKAVLAHLQVEFPRIHYLADLLLLLTERVEVPQAVRRASELSVYAVATRYPDDLPEASVADLAEAVELALPVIEWADSLIFPDATAYHRP